MIKKILLIIITIPVLLVLVKCTSESLRTHSIIEVGDTKLCIPKEYELSVNVPFHWFVSGLDEDAAGGLYIISAGEISKFVEGYTKSHINQYNVDLAHDITGIIWAQSQIGSPDGMAEKAWNLANTEKQPHHIYNASLDLYELGDKRFIDTWWHLARTVPEGKDKERPSDWYFGYCSGKKPENYNCTQDLHYKDLYFDYKVKYQDIHVAGALKEFIGNKFKHWELACES
jgi:hypothetical protein